jgi:pyridoxamine 5'-phosphate oxidase-like protein
VPAWSEVQAAAPELANVVQSRFEATGLGLLGTLRKDGFPRVSGIEPAFALGEVWLGMMPESLKALDLRRDPRLAVHSATADKDVKDGDARITGRAEEVLDGDERRAAYLQHLRDQGGYVPEGPFHLFRIDVTEVMLLHPEGGDHLLIQTWKEGEEVRRIERY